MSSHYWLEMARGAKKTAQILTEKLNSYNTYMNKLYSLLDRIQSTISIMENTKNNYARGGYICEGETLDKGELDSCSGVLSRDCDVVNSVMHKTYYDMNDIQNKINEANDNYQTFMNNYYYALELESQEEIG